MQILLHFRNVTKKQFIGSIHGKILVKKKCQSLLSNVPFLHRWPSIEQFHNVIKHFETCKTATEKDNKVEENFYPINLALKQIIKYQGKV